MSTPEMPGNVAVSKSIVNSNENQFSLLHDDDDEEIQPSVIAGSTTSVVKQKVNVDICNDKEATAVALEGHYYDTVLDQATKWMVELEQIRDATVWCHVENSIHRDVFAMMDLQSTFKYS